MVYVEAPLCDKDDSGQTKANGVRRLCGRLGKSAGEQGLDVPASDRDLNDRSPWDLKVNVFGDSLHRLLRVGAIVVIDEFQNCERGRLDLVSEVKEVIDHHRLERNCSGRIIIAGSHQQQMVRIVGGSREPLYHRLEVLRVGSLGTGDTLRMGSDEDWLSQPGRFLTAWTAFGDVPGLWKNLQDFGSIANRSPTGRGISSNGSGGR